MEHGKYTEYTQKILKPKYKEYARKYKEAYGICMDIWRNIGNTYFFVWFCWVFTESEPTVSRPAPQSSPAHPGSTAARPSPKRLENRKRQNKNKDIRNHRGQNRTPQPAGQSRSPAQSADQPKNPCLAQVETPIVAEICSFFFICVAFSMVLLRFEVGCFGLFVLFGRR